VLKDTKDAAKDVAKDAAKDKHIDASDSVALKSFCKEDELQFIGLEKGDKPDYALPDLSKIKRKKYPIYSTFEKKKTDCYLDCLPKGLICEPSFWDVLYPGGEKAEYLEEGKLDGLHINAFIELMMRKKLRFFCDEIMTISKRSFDVLEHFTLDEIMTISKRSFSCTSFTHTYFDGFFDGFHGNLRFL
ncbi:hypothetical protein Tco_1566490, partial [Tanacetum coccineum]